MLRVFRIGKKTDITTKLPRKKCTRNDVFLPARIWDNLHSLHTNYWY